MYWSSLKYPSLRHLPPAERQAVVQAALKKYGRGSSKRFFIVLAVVIMGGAVAGARAFPRASFGDWRLWVGLAAAAAVLYGYLLWEINGPMYRAVEKYQADRKK
jgi:hypothetical protein